MKFFTIPLKRLMAVFLFVLPVPVLAVERGTFTEYNFDKCLKIYDVIPYVSNIDTGHYYKYIRKQCKKMDVYEIEILENIHNAFKENDFYWLTDFIYYGSFNNYLEISIRPILNLIDANDNQYARDFLLWTIEEYFVIRGSFRTVYRSVAEVVRDNDRRSEILSKLFQKIYPEGNTLDTIHEYFTEIKLDGLSLMEQTIDNQNEVAMDWFIHFINSNHPGCDYHNPTTKSCFEVYCRMGESLGSKKYSFRSTYNEIWIEGFESFQLYLDKIIDCFNRDGESCSDFRPSNWITNKEDDNYIEEAWDLTNDSESSWVNQLCEKVL